jgi:hypothetical protein
VPTKPYSLEQFAYRKQAPMDAITSIVINVVIVVVSLWRLDSVYVMPPPTGFGHSLFGSLFPMAIMSTIMTTVMGVRVTVNKRIAGEVVPPLDSNVRWFKPAFATAVIRAFAALGVISTFGLLTHYNWPLATISVQLAAVVVAGVAAVLGYVESVAAVLQTRDFDS